VTASNDVRAWADGLTPAEKDRVILFFCEQMQAHSPKMDGTCGYRLRSGWPMTHATGRSVGEAIAAAMAERDRHARQ
jgi:hypothetical protein